MHKRTGALIYSLTAALLGLTTLIVTPAMARHGEGNILTNRIPEPAPYEHSETLAGGGQIQNPPFENLWTSVNDTGSCGLVPMSVLDLRAAGASVGAAEGRGEWFILAMRSAATSRSSIGGEAAPGRGTYQGKSWEVHSSHSW